MKTIVITIFTSLIFLSCNDNNDKNQTHVIAIGQMPNIAIDSKSNPHLVFGRGDSIMYSFSSDGGKTFSSPILVAVVPKLFAAHTRGPQIALSDKGITVIASTQQGDIFSYNKTASSNWSEAARVNDVDTTAKEGFSALSADGDYAFAVWLDLRDKHNKIFGAKSLDGGKTWSKNIQVYASPDTTVCECCKPSVIVNKDMVSVMFRNWLDGNRDLYLAQSMNAGSTFDSVKQLGNGHWALKACPMDGGGMEVKNDGSIQTIWRRRETIYTTESDNQEVQIGSGKTPAIAFMNEQPIYSWVENGEIIITTPNKKRINLGEGQLPVIKSLNTSQLICVWEHDKQIYSRLVSP